MGNDGNRYGNKRRTESPPASAEIRSPSTRIICDLSHISKSRQLPSYSSIFIWSLRHAAKRRQACCDEQMVLMLLLPNARHDRERRIRPTRHRSCSVGDLSLCLYPKGKQVRTVIVARHVQGHALAIQCVEIKVCDDNVLLLTQRFDHVFPIWAKDGATSIQQE